ncbi:hypothetical protein PghCCS26_47830 [Paenibacillus glycanilyticus]|uniref:DUF2634 domain-containing protein n=1 Tax=Paenibacillus glycanilyticus TaxID=126569 RepID=A0ABQ6NRE0_9BACL|nr:hypothetical protein [Paenibacillus glycanilyticus]GMK47653.1 hypothetical protein PghCCS26_47830 [Paenibacillus glycanilyticus]
MIHAITYSIVEHLKANIPDVAQRVVWLYDGVTLTGRVKPFITVDQLVNNGEVVAAGRRDYQQIYALQIGVHTRSVGERSKLPEVIERALRGPIPLYDTDGATPVLTAQSFTASVTRITPISPEDVNDETNKHRAYLDVEIKYYVDSDGLTFTQ